MRIAYLGSGSRGNAAVVHADDTVLMVDCGFTVNETIRRLKALDLGLEDLTGILVTHEHGDHIRGVGRLARRTGIPVWMTPGTAAVWTDARIPDLRMLDAHQSLDIGPFRVEPVAVPHDAREPCQFVFEADGRRVGILTDAGHVTPHMVDRYRDCDLMALECNHDLEMLAAGPYPPPLKARVGGDLGHLNNGQSASLLSRLDLSRLQHLVAVHISEKNNHPDLVRQALAGIPGMAPDLVSIARQDAGLPWMEVA